MIYNVYAIRDTKAGFYQAPWLESNDKAAIRTFSEIIRNNSMMSHYPNDYTLYKVATFDPASGVVTGEPAPVFVSNAEVE